MAAREPSFWIDAQRSLAICDGWSEGLREALAAAHISHLQVRAWQQRDLSPLLAVSGLLESMDVGCDVPDLSAVSELGGLRALSLRGGLETIDWARLRSLERLAVTARKLETGNLRESVTLRSLLITGGALQDLHRLEDLAQLTSLTIQEAPLRSLRGIGGLTSLRRLALQQIPLTHLDGLEGAQNLEELSLYMVTALESVAPVARLARLRSLELGACRRVRDIEGIAGASRLERLTLTKQTLPETAFLENLPELRALVLDDVGALPSLEFLAHLGKLEVFRTVNNTRFHNGNLSLLLDLRSLREVAYNDRAGYTHRAEDIMRVLVSRRTWGPGSFHNDAAVRWSQRLRCTGPDRFGDVFRTLNAVSGVADVPALLGQEAVAAAEVVARAYGRWGERSEHSAVADRWVEENRGESSAGLHWHALAALRRIELEPSSLLRLWQERGAAEWIANLKELRGRLSAQ